MAERGIKWRSPGEVWRAYEAKHSDDRSEFTKAVHELYPELEAEWRREADLAVERWTVTDGRDLI